MCIRDSLYSVTVSIAEEINGMPSLIFEVIDVCDWTSVGRIDERAGFIKTSSNERDF